MAGPSDGPSARSLPTSPSPISPSPRVEGEDGRRDLIARFLCRSEEDDDEGPLIDWASRTGYSMLWLPDRLVDARDRPEPPRAGEHQLPDLRRRLLAR